MKGPVENCSRIAKSSVGHDQDRLTDSRVDEVDAPLAVVVLGEGERALDPAEPVDDVAGDGGPLVEHALDGRARAVDVGVAAHQDATHTEDGERQLGKEIKRRGQVPRNLFGNNIFRGK